MKGVHREKIGDEEMKEIIEVLRQYDIDYNRVQKVRSAYKIKGDGIAYCLKKLKHGKSKSKMGKAIVGHLKARGFPYVADYLATKDGDSYIKKNRHTYYMTDWIEGREADFKRTDDLMNGIVSLAQFHRASMEFNEGEVPWMKDHFLKSKKEFLDGKEKLLRYKEKILMIRDIKEWERTYLQYMKYFIHKVNQSMVLFKTYGYDQLIEQDRKTHGFCHQSYYYQNVMVDKNEKFHIIDLDSCARNIYMYDLGKFLRRTLWATPYQWDFKMTKDCIEVYEEIRKLHPMERGILLGIIIFPHKYIRLGGKRLENKDDWDEKKYDKKLKKQISYREKIDKFIEDYTNYYGIHMPK